MHRPTGDKLSLGDILSPLCAMLPVWTGDISVLKFISVSVSISFSVSRFYRAMHFSAKRGIAIVYCLSVCLSVTMRCRDRTCDRKFGR